MTVPVRPRPVNKVSASIPSKNRINAARRLTVLRLRHGVSRVGRSFPDVPFDLTASTGGFELTGLIPRVRAVASFARKSEPMVATWVKYIRSDERKKSRLGYDNLPREYRDIRRAGSRPRDKYDELYKERVIARQVPGDAELRRQSRSATS